MRTEEVKDFSYHLKNAEEYKKSGNYFMQMRELELARRDGLKDKEPLLELYRLYLENGKRRNAKKLLKYLFQMYPDDNEIKDEISEFKKESGETFDIPEIEEEIRGEEKETILPSDEVVLKFVSLFQPREGVYARMWKNPDGKISYSPVNEPFNHKVAKNHLIGNYTVGVYPVRIDNTVLFSAFDVDIKKEYLKEALEYGKEFENLKKTALKVAEDIKEVLSVYGLHSYIEDSGFKGYHVWLFFENPIPAHHVILFMKNVLKGVEKIPDSILVEIFPKQSKVKEGRYGSLIKLPGSFHLKTGVKSYFISAEEGEKGFYDFILKIKKNPKNLIEAVVSNLREEQSEEKHEEIDIRELSFLRAKCAVLDYLIEKAEKDEPLNRDERLAIVYTIGHLKEGPAIVNHLLKKYIERGDLQPLKSRLKGYPMSCAKIRKKLKHITAEVSCSCVFGDEGSYPHPLLHLKELENEKVEFQIKPLVSDFERYVRRYIEIGRQIEELKIEKENIEKYFNEKFDKAGVDTLELKVGKLKRVLHPSGEYKFYYEL